LAITLAGVALAAVTARDQFAAVVLFIVYGLFVAVAWTRLDAVDVALAEAAIGAGLTGVLLIGATARLRPQSTEANARAPMHLAGACAGLAASGALAYAVSATPISEGLRGAVAQNLQATGLANPVTATLLNFRGYDTLLETAILFVALVAAWAATPADLWRESLGPRHHARPQGVLSTFGRLVPPLGLLAAIHLFWSGADSNGGAFQAGAVLAAVWVLAVMAGVQPAPRAIDRPFRALVCVGPAVFLGVGLAGIAAGAFLTLPQPYAKALTLLIEAGLAISVAATLMALVLGAPRRPA
jgi:multisubunit Na+/H+ antiporter MnhB subunit